MRLDNLVPIGAYPCNNSVANVPPRRDICLITGGAPWVQLAITTFFNAQPLVQDYCVVCDNYHMYKNVFADHWVDWTIAIILMIFISVWGQILKTSIEMDQLGDEISTTSSN